jgi:hypothetical protein
MKMKVKVLKDEYWKDCVSIFGHIKGIGQWIPYGLVDGAELVPSSRTDGFENIILTNGKRARVQSIDLEY